MMGQAAAGLGYVTVLISKHHQWIAIVDLCRPSDVHSAQLLAAAMRKQQTYGPLQEAFGQYTEQECSVHVLPWVPLGSGDP